MSEVKVNKISPRSGTTVTLGDSGDTFTIPSGATINNQGTATNFGATGSASWTTTVKTNSDSGFTAVAGEGYFLDTSSGTISVNLPAGTAGAVVAFADYAKNFGTNNVTLVQNGSDKIGGSTANATLETDGISVTLVFIDSTKGWIVTDDGQADNASTAQFITATGGTITTVCTNFKVHTFTGPGTFCVSATGNACGSNTVDYMVVAGGGGGGDGAGGSVNGGGGGGAGGYRESPGSTTSYTASPLGASPAAALPVAATGYPVTIGAGGTTNTPGSNTVFTGTTTITSAGGGEGGSGSTVQTTGCAGGSGGGGNTNPGAGAAGNTPPVSPPQGNNGGAGNANFSGGGGGAGAVGGDGGNPSSGTPGTGTTSSINGTPTTRAAGGAGTTTTGPAAPAQAANTGNGGGGSGHPGRAGGTGGSGVVIIRYKFQ
jgi:hypothetical protein